MLKKAIYLVTTISLLISPAFASALTMPAIPQSFLSMPQTADDLANLAGLNATSYVVADAQSGDILISKNANTPWPPASLTKLVTAMVVLDTKPKFI